MANMDKLMLWGAAAVMAAVGSLSAWKISREPRLDPAVVKAEAELVRLSSSRKVNTPPPQVPDVRLPIIILGPTAPAHDWPATLRPKFIPNEYHRVRRVYSFLPVAVPGEAKADLDRMVVTWSLSERQVNLRDWMIRSEAKPSGFIIQRQCEDGSMEEIGRVGPKERSFTDLSTEPRMTYRYWVVVTGEESDFHSYPPHNVSAAYGLNRSAEARTPAATRMKLVGGDKDNGILLAETYDRAQKKWVGKVVQSVPGRGIGSSGWTLKRLRFDNFTLVADVTDDEGVDRVLTTKN